MTAAQRLLSLMVCLHWGVGVCLPVGGTPLRETKIVVTTDEPGARLYFGDVPVTLNENNGTKRVFNAAPLPPGRYKYDVTVKWGTPPNEEVHARTVFFEPGQHQGVHFRRRPDNYGMDWTPNGAEKYVINDHPVSREQARKALEGKLVDDSHKLRLSFIGKKIPYDPRLEQHCLVEHYEPDYWILKEYGFAFDGETTVYLQKPDGTVLLRLVNPTPEFLNQVVRKRLPDYDPAKDPDGKPQPLLPVALPDVAPILTTGATLALLVGWLLLQRRTP